MGKSKRGKNLKKTEGWRGTCPVCKRTGVKLLWVKTEGENQVKVCKRCGQ